MINAEIVLEKLKELKYINNSNASNNTMVFIKNINNQLLSTIYFEPETMSFRYRGFKVASNESLVDELTKETAKNDIESLKTLGVRFIED